MANRDDIALGIHLLQDHLTRSAAHLGIVANKVANNEISPLVLMQWGEIMESLDNTIELMPWGRSALSRLIEEGRVPDG